MHDVSVPAHLAGPVRDLLVAAVWDLAKTNGGTVHPDLRRLIEQLHTADQHGPVYTKKPAPAAPPTMETTTEAAERMGCSRQYVARLAAAGRLPARRLGRQWLITIEEEPTSADRE